MKVKTSITISDDILEAIGKCSGMNLPTKIAYGFGAGSGSSKEENEQGGGGGGGIAVRPKGVLEITQEETRFISFDETRNMIIGLILGLFLGFMIMRRTSKK